MFTLYPTGSSIRLKGRNLTESEHIKLGAYHTIELEPQRAFTLHKRLWDALDIERIRSACDPQASADLAAVLITVRERAAADCRNMCVSMTCSLIAGRYLVAQHELPGREDFARLLVDGMWLTGCCRHG
eukprot:GHUV01054265.1.p1 GENE.GHUV01054265.1~~GHUV01054265.1.p1  ORF type:complete len:129 (-),score=25.27 GHUV01054265.1:66-452(-)